MPCIPVQEARQLLLTVLIRHGAARREAEVIAEHVLDAELRGKPSHGLWAIPELLPRLGPNRLPMTLVREHGPTALLDGDGQPGPLVADAAMDLAVEKARTWGVGMVGALTSHAFMQVGFPARNAALQGLVGLAFVAGTRKVVAPWGGVDPLLGTNPLAVAVPSQGDPLVLDMATSQIALREIRLALSAGRPIPPACAVDKAGEPTTDPQAALDGALLPFGGYKGYALAFMVEVLTGPLLAFAGAEMGGKAGMLLLALDPGIFGPVEAFTAATARLVTRIKGSRRARSADRILVPGERGEAAYREALARGLDLPEELWSRLLTLAQDTSDGP